MQVGNRENERERERERVLNSNGSAQPNAKGRADTMDNNERKLNHSDAETMANKPPPPLGSAHLSRGTGDRSSVGSASRVHSDAHSAPVKVLGKLAVK